MSIVFVAKQQANKYCDYADVYSGSTNFVSLYPSSNTDGDNVYVVLTTQFPNFLASPPVKTECVGFDVHITRLVTTLEKLANLYPSF